jgi:hypothetical protein
MAVASRYYKDLEIILVTYDSDLEQMWEYENVKIFSPKTKRYKIKKPKFNVYQFLSKKIEKETADNLTNPILNKQDYENRLKCVNLLELPEEIENKIKKELENITPKEEEIELLPFKTIRERFPEIYSKDKIETYEKSVNYYEKKEKRKRKKKSKSKTHKKLIEKIIN